MASYRQYNDARNGCAANRALRCIDVGGDSRSLVSTAHCGITLSEHRPIEAFVLGNNDILGVSFRIRQCCIVSAPGTLRRLF